MSTFKQTLNCSSCNGINTISVISKIGKRSNSVTVHRCIKCNHQAGVTPTLKRIT